jgi:MFS family permease
MVESSLKTETGYAYFSSRLSEPYADGGVNRPDAGEGDRDHHLGRLREAAAIVGSGAARHNAWQVTWSCPWSQPSAFQHHSALGAVIVVISIAFLMTADHPSYARLAIPLVFWSVGMGGGFWPWSAAYSEDSERINPAPVGTAFAVFGVFNRLSIVIGGLLIPHIIGSPVATADGWQVWFICCIVMMLAFIPLCMYGLGGYYRPSRARAALLQRSAAAQAARAGARASGGQDQQGERPALDAT